MKITAIQFDTLWAQPDENRSRLSALMEAATGSDIYVLPEMFSTGFIVEPQGAVEPADGPSLEWMRQMAQRLNAIVAGSVAVEEGGRYYNRFFFVTPDGLATHYDKRHLFTYGGEHRRYTGGNARVVAEHGGVRFLLQVCYDLRFPVWSRNRGDYDVALYVANWPESRIAAWHTLLRARAIENQCYVVGVNRVGRDPVCSYAGGTVMIDPYGRPMATCADGQEGAITADIDLKALWAFRRKFPVLADADDFSLT